MYDFESTTDIFLTVMGFMMAGFTFSFWFHYFLMMVFYPLRKLEEKVID